MADSLDNFEASFGLRAVITPRWLPGNNSVFWYKREVEFGSSKFEFLLANCEKGHHHPAFKHAELALELSKYTEAPVDPYNLHFAWINVDADATWVRFQHDGRTWQYTTDGKLSEWQGDLDKGTFDHGCEQVASPWSRVPVTVNFTNHTTNSIDYLWVSNEGAPQNFGTVHPGQTRTMDTWLGHMWRLEGPDSEKHVVCELKNRRSRVIIEDTPFGLSLSWETDDIVCQQPGSAITDEKVASNIDSQPFLRCCNIWTRKSDGTETQISFDGVADDAFRDIYVSPNGKHVLGYQCKPESQSFAHWIDSSPKGQFPPKLIKQHFLRAGDDVEFKTPRLFDLLTGSEIVLNKALFQNPYALTHIGWSDNSQRYYFIFNERGHQHLRLLAVDTKGAVTVLAEESSKTFVDYNQKMYYKLMPGTNELLWASERDGWNHLYLFNLHDGTLKNQITKGPWVVRSIERVDLDRREIWFEGLGMLPGQDPYYSHLACISFDGSGLRVVTAEGDGTHVWTWGPDRRFLIDWWSRVDLPPRTCVRAADTGRQIMVLHEELPPVALDGRKLGPAPERFTAAGRDGMTEIYGVIVRPRKFDESQRYPIIEYIYAGAQRFTAPKAFQSVCHLRRVADQGYIVVCADGMGTNWRSKAFHDVCYKNLGDGGFADRIAWIRAAAESRPWMDISRVGCYGTSSGGQNAAAAMLHYSSFYKAAVAMAGCHDNRMGKLLWDEMWMGYPVDASYHESSNMTHAHKLGGPLMLVVGGLDTVVDPATTMRFADALVKADKDFDMVYVPGGTHYVSEMPFVQRKQDAFFKRHLQG